MLHTLATLYLLFKLIPYICEAIVALEILWLIVKVALKIQRFFGRLFRRNVE